MIEYVLILQGGLSFAIMLWILMKLRDLQGQLQNKSLNQTVKSSTQISSQGETVVTLDQSNKTKMDRALKNIDQIAEHIRFRKGIRDRGGKLGSALERFINGVDEEFKQLTNGSISDGAEHVRRRNMLLFALTMAEIYAEVKGQEKNTVRFRAYVEKAKKLA